jgi:hypothetical protein
MDYLYGITIVSIIGTLSCVGYAWKRFSLTPRWFLFTGMMFVLLCSFFPMSTDHFANEWFRHGLFYIAQLLFYFFLLSLVRIDEDEGENKPVMPEMPAAFPFFGWMQYMTQNGLSDILTVPFFILSFSYFWAKRLFIEYSSIRKALWWFMSGFAVLIFSHIVEFYSESQGWMVGMISNVMGVIYVIALIPIAVGLYYSKYS